MGFGGVEVVVIVSLAAICFGGFHILVPVGLAAWGRWVARRHGGRGWRWAAWLPLAALVLGVVGVTVGSDLLIGAFRDVASAHPEEKATILSNAISEAMNCSALLLLPEWLLLATSGLVFVVGSIHKPARGPGTTSMVAP